MKWFAVVTILAVLASRDVSAQTPQATTHLGGKASALVNLQVQVTADTDWQPFQRILPDGTDAPGDFTLPQGSLLVVTDLDVWTWGAYCKSAKGWIAVPNGQVPQITFDSREYAAHQSFLGGVVFSAPPVVYVGSGSEYPEYTNWLCPYQQFAFVTLRGYLVADE